MTGKVLFYKSKKGYGFIKQDKNPADIFFHFSNCNDIPEEKMRVQYEIAEGRKGLEAVNVSIIYN